MSTYPLVIPYDEKDIIKTMYKGKIKWDNEKKTWYTTCNKTYTKLTQYHKHVLSVPFIHKDKAKGLGAKWDGSNWYVNEGLYQKCQSDFDSLVDIDPDEDEDT
jgi:hypothetical protein